MDYVKVEDHENNVCYNFTCSDWFSVESDDYKTMRILDVEEMTSVSTPGQKARLKTMGQRRESTIFIGELIVVYF